MKINICQIKELESLIREGIMSQSHALEGKKKYVKKVQEWLGTLYQENNEDIPFWVYKITIPRILIANDICIEDENKFYDESLGTCLQQLEQLRTEFYLRRHLEDSMEQAQTAQKNLEVTQESLKCAQASLQISQSNLRYAILGILLSVLTSVFTINCCTNTVKLEEQQYQTIKSKLKQDGIVSKSTINQ